MLTPELIQQKANMIDEIETCYKQTHGFDSDRRLDLMTSMGEMCYKVGQSLPHRDMEVGPTGTIYSHQGNAIDNGIRDALHGGLQGMTNIIDNGLAIRFEHLRRVATHNVKSKPDETYVLVAELDGTSNFAIKYRLFDENGRKGDFEAESALTLTLCNTKNPYFPMAVAIYDFSRGKLHTASLVDGKYQAFIDGDRRIRKDIVQKRVKAAVSTVENPRLYVASYVNDFHRRDELIYKALQEYRDKGGRRIEVKTGTQSTVVNGLRVILEDECDTIGAYDSRSFTVADIPKGSDTRGSLEKTLGKGFELAGLKFDDAISIATLSEGYGCPVYDGKGNPLWMNKGVDLLDETKTHQITMAQIWDVLDETGLEDENTLMQLLSISAHKSQAEFEELLRAA